MTQFDSETDLAMDLAAYATDVLLDDLPESAVERTKLVVLDTIGVCLRGSQTPYVREAVSNAELLDGAKPMNSGATTFATFDRRSPWLAAFANAAGGTTLELDEGNQRSAHMGIHIVPPAIAVAEQFNASGRELLEAVAAAYETSARVGDAIRPQKDGLHPHGTWAPIGAAVAAGLLRGLDREELTEAIRIAVNPFVASHWSAALEGATVRNFYTGVACRHGIQSVTLAQSGVTGVVGAIERCLFPYVAGEDDALDTLADEIDGLGDEYYLESSYFKVHAACRYAHAPIEAFEKVLESTDLDLDEVESIDVSTFGSGCLLADDTPGTVLEAKFSTPYALGVLAVLGTTGVDAFAEEHLDVDRIKRLASMVDVSEDPVYQRRAREGRWGAAVTVETADGRLLQEFVADARGGGDNPFSQKEIREKFHSLVDDVDEVTDPHRLEANIMDLDRAFDEIALFDNRI